VDKENQYDDDSVRTLLNLIVNKDPADSNALRTVVDTLAGRVKSIESELDASCGDAVCSPGSYVKTACNPADAVARDCATCVAGTYSYGGLVDTCLDCNACIAGFHEVAPCSPVSNRVCAKCQSWWAAWHDWTESRSLTDGLIAVLLELRTKCKHVLLHRTALVLLA
jgi:hypothetical protein